MRAARRRTAPCRHIRSRNAGTVARALRCPDPVPVAAKAPCEQTRPWSAPVQRAAHAPPVAVEWVACRPGALAWSLRAPVRGGILDRLGDRRMACAHPPFFRCGGRRDAGRRRHPASAVVTLLRGGTGVVGRRRASSRWAGYRGEPGGHACSQQMGSCFLLAAYFEMAGLGGPIRRPRSK